MMKKFYIFLLNLLLISCYVNTTPVKSDYTVVEDTPPETSSSTPPTTDDNITNLEDFKEYQIFNIGNTPKVYVNSANFFARNDELENYYKSQVENKKVIDKDTKEERYRFDNNLDIIKYNNGDKIIYKEYIRAVLVKMSDSNYPLHGKYVVGAIYKVEKDENGSTTSDKYEILVYNNHRHYSVDGKMYYVMTIFNIPSSDVSEKYNPENVYNGKYSYTKNDYSKWTIAPVDFVR